MATKKQVMAKVKLDREGVLACGDYEAGVIYDVTKAEADRLIKAKGFKLITEGKN